MPADIKPTVETKEHAVLSWPPDVHPAEATPDAHPRGQAGDLARARAVLAAEWRAADPRTPDDIRAFYQQAHGIADDLDAWHALTERQEWTRMLVHVAWEARAQHIIDIGCGAGHDLLAVQEALPRAYLEGVEPNALLREEVVERSHLLIRGAVEPASIERADLLICIDVLEHVPDPESFLGSIAQRAPVGCLLFEATATHDTGTPLHLVENRGWHPGRCLERGGWELADRDQTGRVRVWRRTREAGTQRASVLLCAYRNVCLGTLQSLLELCAPAAATQGNRWRLKVKGGDALIARSRSILLSAWWRETADDIALFVDDDLVFSAQDADRLAELCRNGHDIICGAYPVHDGSHLACRFWPRTGEVAFGPGQPPLAIQYAATGFMAVHRRVLDALTRCLPLCHADQPWSFFPFFEARTSTAQDGLIDWLSEDYGFSELARGVGFGVWLDPQTRLEHRGECGMSVVNMAAMHGAMAQV